MEKNTEFLKEWVEYHERHSADLDALIGMVEDDERLDWILDHPEFDSFTGLDECYAISEEIEELNEEIQSIVNCSPSELANRFNIDDENQAVEEANIEIRNIEEKLDEKRDSFEESFHEYFSRFY